MPMREAVGRTTAGRAVINSCWQAAGRRESERPDRLPCTTMSKPQQTVAVTVRLTAVHRERDRETRCRLHSVSSLPNRSDLNAAARRGRRHGAGDACSTDCQANAACWRSLARPNSRPNTRRRYDCVRQRTKLRSVSLSLHRKMHRSNRPPESTGGKSVNELNSKANFKKHSLQFCA